MYSRTEDAVLWWSSAPTWFTNLRETSFVFRFARMFQDRSWACSLWLQTFVLTFSGSCTRAQNCALKSTHSTPRRNVRKNFFLERVLFQWNVLPIEILQCASLAQFKTALRLHLHVWVCSYVITNLTTKFTFPTTSSQLVGIKHHNNNNNNICI